MTSRHGANRVYDLRTEPVVLQSRQSVETVADTNGGLWHVTEEALVREGPDPIQLPRVVAARAFWFGWYAQFPETMLVQ